MKIKLINLIKHHLISGVLFVLFINSSINITAKTIFNLKMPEKQHYYVELLAYKTLAKIDSFDFNSSNSNKRDISKLVLYKEVPLIIHINYYVNDEVHTINMSFPVIKDSINTLVFKNLSNLNDCKYEGNIKLNYFNRFYRNGLFENTNLTIKALNTIDSNNLKRAREKLFIETINYYNYNLNNWNILILEALGYIEANHINYNFNDELSKLNKSFCDNNSNDPSIKNYKEVFCKKVINYEGIDSINIFLAKTVNLKDTIIRIPKNGLYILDFWATWCKPCLQELSFYDSLIKKSDKSFNFIFVSVDSDEKKWLNFYINHNVLKNYQNYIDMNNNSGLKYKFSTIPSNFIFYNGNLISKNKHGKDLEDLLSNY
jgi:thiol-disulfide isomerase/thioredoxin